METPSTHPEKFARLVELVRGAKHLVVYTGAGISTAASIPDFRGKGGLLSGPGKGVLGIQEHLLDEVMPTYSHVAITKMLELGFAHFLTTSNHDNLHQKSGAPDVKISNLFGNAYVEECLLCKKQYKRHTVPGSIGRRCDSIACGGRLVKTGVRFGQTIPAGPYASASKEAPLADVSLVIGSSLTVEPLGIFSMKAKKSIICLDQSTPYDSQATLVLRSKCDVVMRHLTEALGIDIGNFVYKQEMLLSHTKDADKIQVIIQSPYTNESVTCIEEVKLQWKAADGTTKTKQMEEAKTQFELQFEVDAEELEVTIEFKGAFAVEPLKVVYSIAAPCGSTQLYMEKAVEMSRL